MVTLKEMQIEADKQMETLIPPLASKQTTYRKKHKRFWQGISTPDAKPADGATVKPDKSKRPTNQAESWDDFGVTVPADIYCTLAVDVYDGSAGQGYQVRGHLTHEGAEYYRVRHAAGPETWREMPRWRTVVEV